MNQTSRLAALSALTLGALLPQFASAQGTAFTYQGRLNLDTGTATNGIYEMTFGLYGVPLAGASIASNLRNVPVTNGLFTTGLDFGPQFDGTPRFLQIAVRPAGSPNPAEILAPRQALLPTPYAIFAGTAASVSTNVTQTFSPPAGPPFNVGNSNKVANLNADLLDGLDSTAFWKTGGNAGTTPGVNFVGTTDNKSLELRVNNGPALQLLPGSIPNLLRAGNANAIDPATTGGSILGGSANRILSTNNTSSVGSTIAAGNANTVESYAYYSFIGGGANNQVSYDADRAAILAGNNNLIGTNADESIIGGGNNNQIGDGSKQSGILAGSGNTIEASSAASLILGGLQNHIGSFNNAGDFNFIGGGRTNYITGSAVGMTLSGGASNTVTHSAAFGTIGGGFGNEITSEGAPTLVGATIGGGYNNTAIGSYSTVPGGRESVAGTYSFAAGFRARAVNDGTFVWADNGGSGFNFESVTANEFAARAVGGVRFVTATSGGNPTAGVRLASGGTAWGVISDKNQKKGQEPVDGKEVLAKLADLPITSWHYRWENDGETRHIGPMAQDFKHAFYPGRDDTVITTLETDGVTLAAIQGLNSVVKEKEARIEQLEKRLADLEKLVRASVAGKHE